MLVQQLLSVLRESRVRPPANSLPLSGSACVFRRDVVQKIVRLPSRFVVQLMFSPSEVKLLRGAVPFVFGEPLNLLARHVEQRDVAEAIRGIGGNQQLLSIRRQTVSE